MKRSNTVQKSSFFKKKNRWDNISAYLFLSPALLGFTIFIAMPIIATFALCFFDYNIIQPPDFVGLDNFKEFFRDPNTPISFGNTFKFLAIFTPMHCILGLILAYAVYRIRHGRLRNVIRGIVYFPSIVTTASVAIIFVQMFATDTGFINYYVRQLGMNNIPWLTDSNLVYLTLAIFSFWKFIGTTFLYYFIGLNNVPESYYESASIDGANTFQIFTRITVPLITPTIFFVVVTNMIGVFQTFDEPSLITNGGPGTATRTVALQIYRTAFQSNQFGYGATFAFVLFLIIMVVTIIQYVGQKKWVVYDYE